MIVLAVVRKMLAGVPKAFDACPKLIACWIFYSAGTMNRFSPALALVSLATAVALVVACGQLWRRAEEEPADD